MNAHFSASFHRELESENATLQEEYQHLKASTSSGSNSGTSAGSSGVHSNGSSSSSSGAPGTGGKATRPKLCTYYSGNCFQTSVFSSPVPPPLSSEAEILKEAKLLREHKERLESRMRILEEHNQQLVSQLGKLKMFMEVLLSTAKKFAKDTMTCPYLPFSRGRLRPATGCCSAPAPPPLP